ncbi:MAG: hypothetical protein K2Y39_20035 [Candidatus Obscuribacterales bacterium]|nr:hypothetical protein [Candidatus Obscuribacterales bacterium]
MKTATMQTASMNTATMQTASMNTATMQTAAMNTAEMKAVESKIAATMKAASKTAVKQSGKAGAISARELKKHLKYMMPEIKLALIKEPGEVALPVQCPEDIERFVTPMKFYSDFVPQLNMCRSWQQAHPVRGGALALRHINFKGNPAISAALHPLSNEHQRDMFHLT